MKPNRYRYHVLDGDLKIVRELTCTLDSLKRNLKAGQTYVIAQQGAHVGTHCYQRDAETEALIAVSIQETLDQTQRRIQERGRTMAVPVQLEAVIDMAKKLDAAGIDVGDKMRQVISEDNRIRGEVT